MVVALTGSLSDPDPQPGSPDGYRIHRRSGMDLSRERGFRLDGIERGRRRIDAARMAMQH